MEIHFLVISWCFPLLLFFPNIKSLLFQYVFERFSYFLVLNSSIMVPIRLLLIFSVCLLTLTLSSIFYHSLMLSMSFCSVFTSLSSITLIMFQMCIWTGIIFLLYFYPKLIQFTLPLSPVVSFFSFEILYSFFAF